MHNKRFPQIWEILTRHLDFNRKKVLDVGCGHGDLLLAAYEQGAFVRGIDFDKNIINTLRHKLGYLVNDAHFQLICEDIDNWFAPEYKADIVTCFSVLPYLTFPWDAVNEFAKIAPLVVLEIQYAGDGPGFAYLKTDNDCRKRLVKSFVRVKKIGETLVEDRNKLRTIWLCES